MVLIPLSDEAPTMRHTPPYATYAIIALNILVFFWRSSVSSGEDIGPLRAHPSEKLQAIWAWNRRRASWNDELGDAVFVPAIGFFEVEDSTYSAVIWPDAVPVLLPQVDVVVSPSTPSAAAGSGRLGARPSR